MSLSNDVKTELCECETPEKLGNVFVYGLLYGFRGAGNTFVTRDRRLAGFVRKQLPRNGVSFSETKCGNGTSYCISVGPEHAGVSEKIDTALIGGSDECTGIFLRGAFITCGNVYVQKAGYHLELRPATAGKCGELMRLINEHGMVIRSSRSGKNTFLYSKDSENISDILTYMGAMQCAMEIMNIKILKEVRSNINRSVNCETANITKIVNAAGKQAEDIELIFGTLGADKLPDDLREIAELRLANPDMSLRDLGARADPPISRSGVNHRFERLAKIAEEIRNKQQNS